MNDLTADIIRYEDGELTHEETVILFQGLVDYGMLCHLQGSYHRMARILMERGEIA